MNITLRQLSYFHALTKTHHFGRAAELMNISQPALSVQIKELETALGVQLVERHTREVVISTMGQEVLGYANRILQNVADLEQAVRWQNGLTGKLSLGVIPTIAPYLLPKALPGLKAQNTDLDLRISEAQTSILLTDLDQGRLDAAIITLPSAHPGLIELPLFVDRFFLVGSNSSLLSAQKITTHLRPKSIDPNILLLLDEGHCLADQALEVCGLQRSMTQMDLRASSLSTLCGLAAGGFGLTFLPEIATPQESAANPKLARYRFDDPEPFRQIGLVRRALTQDDGWFSELASHLQQAGCALIKSAGTI